jgi:hypothetical protein
LTYLIGGSLTLIVLSTVALVFGWLTENEPMVWISIAASVFSAILLAVAYSQSRALVPRVSAGRRRSAARKS